MDFFRDSGYAYWVDKAISDKPEVGEIIRRVGEDGLYLIGGAVRDSVVNFLYGKSLDISDYDFFSSSKSSEDLRKIFADYENVLFSRFGNPKFYFDGFEIDLVSFDNTIAENVFHKNPTIEGVLSSSDINTSSIGYSIFNSDFYSCWAMEGILNSRVDIVNSTSLVADLSRLILHSNKLDFNLGEKSLEFISENYCEDLDCEILSYLDYKNKLDKADLVLSVLKDVSCGRVFR